MHIWCCAIYMTVYTDGVENGVTFRRTSV